MEALHNIQRYCHNCNFWLWDENIILPDGTIAYPGHCGLYSTKCINAVADGDTLPPPNYLSMEETFEEPQESTIN